MAIHLLTAKQIAVASTGHLSDGGGVVLRIRGDQGRWWFRYTSAEGRRRAMSLGAAAIRGDSELIEQSLRNAREIAAEAGCLLSRGHDPLELRNATKAQARTQIHERKSAHKKELLIDKLAPSFTERVLRWRRLTLPCERIDTFDLCFDPPAASDARTLWRITVKEPVAESAQEHVR